MGLRLRHGFDLSTNLAHYGTASGGSIGAFGRNGTSGLRFTISNSFLGMPLESPLGELFFGFAFRAAPITGGAVNGLIMSVSSAGSVVAEMRQDFDGFMHLTGIGNTGLFLPYNEYHYIEARLVIGNATAGRWTVRYDGVQIFDTSGIDTSASGATTCATFTLGGRNEGSGGSNAWNHDYDDLVVMDTSGSELNGFLGDVRVVEQLPTGDGDEEFETLSSGSDSYALVDEGAASETDYVETNTAGDKALFTFPSLPVSPGVVHSVGVSAFARKTDAGSRVIRGIAKHGGTTGNMDSKSIGDTNAYHRGDLALNPSTGLAWTIAEVDASQVGVELVS